MGTGIKKHLALKTCKCKLARKLLIFSFSACKTPLFVIFLHDRLFHPLSKCRGVGGSIRWHIDLHPRARPRTPPTPATASVMHIPIFLNLQNTYFKLISCWCQNIFCITRMRGNEE